MYGNVMETATCSWGFLGTGLDIVGFDWICRLPWLAQNECYNDINLERMWGMRTPKLEPSRSKVRRSGNLGQTTKASHYDACDTYYRIVVLLASHRGSRRLGVRRRPSPRPA